MRVKKLLTSTFLSGGLVVVCAPTANAATATSVLAVTATVVSTCVVTAVPLVFGNYIAVLLTVNATLTVFCTAGTTFNIGLDAGIGTGATVSTRHMTFGANTLAYTLSSNAAHTVNIGQTIGTDTIAGTGTGLLQTYTVYGQVTAGQYPPPGAYADTVTATITY